MTYGEKHKIKTYLVPTTYEMVETMEKGEAPSFLHCATCLDGLTNGEVVKTLFPSCKTRSENTPTKFMEFTLDGIVGYSIEKTWWNRKWGEQA